MRSQIASNPRVYLQLTSTNILKTTQIHVFALAPRKVIQDSIRFWIPSYGFRIPDVGFRILPVQIPDSKT